MKIWEAEKYSQTICFEFPLPFNFFVAVEFCLFLIWLNF